MWYDDDLAREALFESVGKGISRDYIGQIIYGLGQHLTYDDRSYQRHYLALAVESRSGLVGALSHFEYKHLRLPESFVRAQLKSERESNEEYVGHVINFLIDSDSLQYRDIVAPYVQHENASISMAAKNYLKVAD